jgi:DNA adenine methylase
VTLENLYKTPWPWFGGKADAAPAVWDALGDVDHYVEPFAGSLAVLLRRPHTANRTYHSETVNDLDGLLCNAWRAIARDPDAVADAASWPVCESDLHARHLALLAWRAAGNAERLMADPDFYDARMAGWWAWGQSCWIGAGWCSGRGSWVVGADGRIAKRTKGEGVKRQLPHISDDGRGVARPQAREEGVARTLPHTRAPVYVRGRAHGCRGGAGWGGVGVAGRGGGLLATQRRRVHVHSL